MPKNIIHDKEQLYEEILQLKQDHNETKLENVRLKTKLQQFEAELAKKDKEIKSAFDRMTSPAAVGATIKDIKTKRSKVGTHLVSALKKKVQDVQRENATLREGLELLKKSVRLTATQELEAEVKAYSDECLRMRKLLEGTRRPANDSPGAEERLREQLEAAKREIGELKERLRAKLHDAPAAGAENETFNQKALMNEQMREIQRLKDRIESIKKAAAKQQQPTEEAKRTLTRQAEEIKALEERTRSQEEELRALRAGAEKQQQEQESQQREEQKATERVPVVSSEEVQTIATELRLKLMLARVDSASVKSVSAYC